MATGDLLWPETRWLFTEHKPKQKRIVNHAVKRASIRADDTRSWSLLLEAGTSVAVSRIPAVRGVLCFYEQRQSPLVKCGTSFQEACSGILYRMTAMTGGTVHPYRHRIALAAGTGDFAPIPGMKVP